MKTVDYIIGLGNELKLTAKHAVRLLGWLLLPVWLVTCLPIRISRCFVKEMYQRKTWIPKWKQTTSIANLRIDIGLGAIVVFLGLLSML